MLLAIRLLRVGAAEDTVTPSCSAISPRFVAQGHGHDITDAAVASDLKVWRQKSLTPDAIARAIRFALEQPDGVDINEVVVRPTAAGM